MKLLFVILLAVSFNVMASTTAAIETELGETATECPRMKEDNRRFNPKENLQFVKAARKNSTRSKAIRI